MSKNPKHQFHKFLRKHHIPFTQSTDRTTIQNIVINYRYDDETIRLYSPLSPDITFFIPFADPLQLFIKFMRFRDLVNRFHATRLDRFMNVSVTPKYRPSCKHSLGAVITK